MTSRILLISTNRCSTPDAVFPLGLSHVNAALRRAGHQTRWVDCFANDQSLPDVLAEYRPDFVGVSVRNIDDVLIRKRQCYFGELNAICETVRRVNPCPVILGGSGYSIFPERLLKLAGADYGIQGEAEQSFPDLIAALAQGGDMASIAGLVYHRGRAIVVNPQHPSPMSAALEAIDRPVSLVSHYLKTGGMLNLQTQRGCSYACCYCTYPLIEARAHRRRPPGVVADEMAQLQAQGAKYVFVVDSIFNSSPRHIVETCEAIIRRELDLQWGCFLRPQGLTRELVRIMARAGLSHIEFGSDSFCDSVLDEYEKHLTFDDILQSNELAQEQGIDCCHFLICGGPGETWKTLQTSFQNSQQLRGAVFMAVVGMRIYPGTTLCERALREERITADTDLLTPTYYLAPDLTVDSVFDMLREFAASSPNWIVADPAPEYAKLVERLRRRGVVGPLWSYLSKIQRLWPSPVSAKR